MLLSIRWFPSGRAPIGWSGKSSISSAFVFRAIRICGASYFQTTGKAIACAEITPWRAIETCRTRGSYSGRAARHDNRRDRSGNSKDDGPQHGTAARVNAWSAEDFAGAGRRNGGEGGSGSGVFAHGNREVLRRQNVFSGHHAHGPDGLSESAGEQPGVLPGSGKAARVGSAKTRAIHSRDDGGVTADLFAPGVARDACDRPGSNVRFSLLLSRARRDFEDIRIVYGPADDDQLHSNLWAGTGSAGGLAVSSGGWADDRMEGQSGGRGGSSPRRNAKR